MLRFLAGAAASFLLMVGAFLIWQSRAQEHPLLPSAPQARSYGESMIAQTPLQAPEASPQSREQKRFSRYDHNKDGKVEADEYLAARRRNFDKLDVDHNGALSFEEYAAKGIEKFDAAGGRKGWLSPAEFVATAPPPAKRKTCSCGRPAPVQTAENSDD
ncbi:MAG TPA: EF-hand domain-containing protein [Sphingomicrobium sp.]|nr:EF-hand domain-containing protein [Sphingomicrobium sp.]